MDVVIGVEWVSEVCVSIIMCLCLAFAIWGGNNDAEGRIIDCFRSEETRCIKEDGHAHYSCFVLLRIYACGVLCARAL